jgi:BatD DUF11 like domain
VSEVRRFGFFTVLLFCAAHARAEVRVTVQSSAEQVAVDDTVDVQIVVSIRGEEQFEQLVPPPFDGFEVENSSEGNSTSLTVVNGRRSMSTDFRTTFTLRATLPGKHDVSNARAVLANGKEVGPDKRVVVEVTGEAKTRDAADGESSNADMIERFGGKIPQTFLDVQPSTVTAVVGEQIVVTTTLWTEVSLSGEPRLPALRPEHAYGVLIKDNDAQPGKPKQVRRTWSGRPFVGFVLRREALFPLQPGKLELPALTTTVQRGRFGGSKDLKLTSTPTSIEVQALPPVPDGGTFSGIVGTYRLERSFPELTSASGQARMPRADDVFTHRLVLRGTGNIDLAVLPEIRFAPGTKTYAPTTSKTTETVNGLAGGSLTVDTLLAAPAGTFVVPEVRVVVFDPEQRLYVPLVAAKESWTIAAGAARAASATTKPNVTVSLPSMARLPAFNMLSSLWWPLLLCTSSLLVLMALWVRQQKRSDDAVDDERAFSAGLKSGDIDTLQALVLAQASARTGVDLTGLSAASIAQLSALSSLDRGLPDRLARFITDVESSRFGGGRRPIAEAQALFKLLSGGAP